MFCKGSSTCRMEAWYASINCDRIKHGWRIVNVSTPLSKFQQSNMITGTDTAPIDCCHQHRQNQFVVNKRTQTVENSPQTHSGCLENTGHATHVNHCTQYNALPTRQWRQCLVIATIPATINVFQEDHRHKINFSQTQRGGYTHVLTIVLDIGNTRTMVLCVHHECGHGVCHHHAEPSWQWHSARLAYI